MEKTNLSPTFSLFKTYEQLFSPSEAAVFLRLLDRKIKFVKTLEISLIVSLILGVIWWALYGYFLPYYDIVQFYGWVDWAAMYLLVALLGIPILFFLLFNAIPERLTFFYAILNGLVEEIKGEAYYVKVSVWGHFSIKKIPYHIGGYALTQKDNRWYGGTVIYSQSSTVYYDHLKKSNRYSTKFYASFSLFQDKTKEFLELLLLKPDFLENFVQHADNLASIEAASYRHLGRKGQFEKIQSEIKLGFQKAAKV